MQIWVAGVDKELTSDGIITPGLGDSASAFASAFGKRSNNFVSQGDRLFNTVR